MPFVQQNIHPITIKDPWMRMAVGIIGVQATDRDVREHQNIHQKLIIEP